MNPGKEGSADGGPEAAVTESCVMGEAADWFHIFGDLKLFCHGLIGWFSWREGSPSVLDSRWCIKSVQSCSGSEQQNDFTCFVLRHR